MILLSLDGAGAQQLSWLYDLGALDQGGFGRFFDDGLVATALVPPTPTLTATSHVTLATGYLAGDTGIVANSFHRPEDEWLQTTSGFSGEIGTETLWEAARRQGRSVGAIAWVGVDFTNERRSADWGLSWAGRAAVREHLFELTQWVPATELPAGVDGPNCHSVRTELSDELALDWFLAGEQLWVSWSGDPAVALSLGEWNRVMVDGAPIELKWTEFSAGDSTGDSTAVVFQAARYDNPVHSQSFAELLAREQLVWPGAPSDRSFEASQRGEAGIDLETWLEQSHRFAGYFGGAIRLAIEGASWDLLLAYLPVIDEAAHTLTLVDRRQPGFDEEKVGTFGRAVVDVWRRVDRELAELLEAVDLNTTTVVVVSDHGLSPTHTTVFPNVILEQAGLLVSAEGRIVEASALHAVTSGHVAHLYLRDDVNATAGAEQLEQARQRFVAFEHQGEAVFPTVVSRAEAAALGLDHPNSGDLIAIARSGYYLGSRGFEDGLAAVPSNVRGMHGTLNTDPSMHGIFLALGRGVERARVGQMPATRVAGAVSEWLGIEPPRRQPSPAE